MVAFSTGVPFFLIKLTFKNIIMIDDIFAYSNELQEILDNIDDSEINNAKDLIDKSNYQSSQIIFRLILSLLDSAAFVRPFKIKLYVELIEYIHPSISSFFSSDELTKIVTHNTLRLILVKHKLLDLHSFINIDSIDNSQFTFFAQEIYENHLYNASEESDLLNIINNLSKDHDQLRLEGVNDKNIARIIRMDNIDEFQDYVSSKNVSFDSPIPRSLYETNLLLLKDLHMPTFIEYAAFCSSIQIFRYLILNEAKLTKSVSKYAAASGNCDIIHILENHSVKFETECINYAALFHQNAIFDYLKDTIRIPFNEETLIFSIFSRNFYTFSIVFEHFIHDTLICEHGLYHAIKSGNLEFTQHIINNVSGIDLNKVNPSNEENFLHTAASAGSSEIVQLLLETGKVDPYIRGSYNQTAVHFAAIVGYADVLKLLIETNMFDINDQEIFGSTAIHLAAKHGKTKAVEYLVTVDGIDINIKNHDHCTALRYATYNNYVDVARILLSMPNIDFKEKSSGMQNILHLAARTGAFEIAKLVTQKENVDLNAKGVLGYTALHWAAQEGFINIVKLLCSLDGIDINSRDKRKNTPFHKAFERGKDKIVEYLLSLKGIDVEARNVDNLTPFEISMRSKMKKNELIQ
ncbi:hypothetical protein TRFO_09566 [Tritrichomonas foetus]|uniref:DUF3447 domain-containing protein n=1 Tax=Tritrichomonas foetus TaxID=1144522 RepID=A0A1J4JDQ1_9EUKA|nr:hypothetical protein TRFO_09566 [Tritrichomonas foetus]|eukprot:OHS97282.1 hypothetical protein TRFO_09566 [Tritrichomonas foetus]